MALCHLTKLPSFKAEVCHSHRANAVAIHSSYKLAKSIEFFGFNMCANH